MPQDSEQSQARRRRMDAGGQNALPLPMYPRAAARNALPSTQTNAYFIDDIDDPPRSNTSAIRLDNPQIAQATRVTGAQISPENVPTRRQGLIRNTTTSRQARQPGTTVTSTIEKKPRKRMHWLVLVGVGMMAMLVLWMLGAVIVAWGTQRYYDVRYGIPRTFQIDEAVGHGGDSVTHPSHFIAMNLNRQAIIVEFKAGDPAHSVSYVSPGYIGGDGGELVPVTLEFRDVTGDGKKDMIIHIHLRDQDQISVFINDGDQFRPATPTDKIHP